MERNEAMNKFVKKFEMDKAGESNSSFRNQVEWFGNDSIRQKQVQISDGTSK